MLLLQLTLIGAENHLLDTRYSRDRTFDTWSRLRSRTKTLQGSSTPISKTPSHFLVVHMSPVPIHGMNFYGFVMIYMFEKSLILEYQGVRNTYQCMYSVRFHYYPWEDTVCYASDFVSPEGRNNTNRINVVRIDKPSVQSLLHVVRFKCDLM